MGHAYARIDNSCSLRERSIQGDEEVRVDRMSWYGLEPVGDTGNGCNLWQPETQGLLRVLCRIFQHNGFRPTVANNDAHFKLAWTEARLSASAERLNVAWTRSVTSSS